MTILCFCAEQQASRCGTVEKHKVKVMNELMQIIELTMIRHLLLTGGESAETPAVNPVLMLITTERICAVKVKLFNALFTTLSIVSAVFTSWKQFVSSPKLSILDRKTFPYSM